ncbi:hypothetical protein NDU88_005450 [Pleurodeles waltl]|uniref:Uncharacterized protein n=1 Tax=Pleurodeles waltl TaxID=8319 RepID=A0AAV7QFP6_PLEWA|nr:hypothetical protein NDU88_005450 [Pleurodeles waltl]
MDTFHAPLASETYQAAKWTNGREEHTRKAKELGTPQMPEKETILQAVDGTQKTPETSIREVVSDVSLNRQDIGIVTEPATVAKKHITELEDTVDTVHELKA